MNFIHSVLLVLEEKTFTEIWEMLKKERLLDLEETPQQMNTIKQQFGEHRSMNLVLREKLRPQQEESERKDMATQIYKQKVGKLEQNTEEEPHERGLLDDNRKLLFQPHRARKICLNEEVHFSVLPCAPPPPPFFVGGVLSLSFCRSVLCVGKIFRA